MADVYRRPRIGEVFLFGDSRHAYRIVSGPQWCRATHDAESRTLVGARLGHAAGYIWTAQSHPISRGIRCGFTYATIVRARMVNPTRSHRRLPLTSVDG